MSDDTKDTQSQPEASEPFNSRISDGEGQKIIDKYMANLKEDAKKWKAAHPEKPINKDKSEI